MHTDIVLKHAQGSTMDCRSCHDEKDARQLKLMDGTPVSFDAAYRVCAQCHFQQHRDWANGAHGKRLNQWQGERVVLSCTGCHNPHSPAFDKRFPKARPTLPGTRPYSTELPKELGAPHGGHGHE
jgi:formate-dependent nitrite reductase cytochrome c552 subunit